MPGAILRAASGAVRAASIAQDSGGEYASGSKIRPRPPRRAGSTKTASYGPVSISMTSAQRTSIRSVRPSASAFARAVAAVSGSRSTASTRMPARASAMASPPMPQQRSATQRDAQRGKRRGAVLGDRSPGRLLDPVRREVHPVRVLGAELRHRPLPQPCLPECRRDQFGRVLAAQPGGDGQLLGRVVVAQLVEQGAALGGEERGEVRRGRSPAHCGPAGGRVGGRRRCRPGARRVADRIQRHAAKPTKRKEPPQDLRAGWSRFPIRARRGAGTAFPARSSTRRRRGRGPYGGGRSPSR